MKRMKIDFVSDVVCPWCAIGLNALEQAIQRLDGELSVELQVQPFELNPQMPPEGEEIVAHLTRKYGITPEDCARNTEMIRVRGETVGFRFGRRSRTYNTFDAHRLLHWAGLEGRQRELKHALLRAYFTDGENVADPGLLVRVAGEAGLDPQRAQALLGSDEFATEVREQEQLWLDRGIHSVPSIVIDDRHLIQGGQPVEVFEQVLRELSGKI
ncbi:disulfide bond formation protein DsbA [Methylibium sp. Pch-M]|uniref:DsbA family oxidoreductase n=1 Tax=Methylibium sp. Pch-M TaxID=2082386 RepID=UPI0010113C1F|nr:DsbA family oxidoreductase [Methylibium sp. Pch-M]QAZ37997.1 disulfide bond formation protein DsbA [Methylibium sp. Pch-M]